MEGIRVLSTDLLETRPSIMETGLVTKPLRGLIGLQGTSAEQLYE